MKIMLYVCMGFFLSTSLMARDSLDPFLDPADSDPAESLRRSGRMMSSLRRSSDKEDIKELADELADRLTRTLLAMEREAKNNSSSSSSGGGSKSKSKSKNQTGQQNKNQRQEEQHKNAPSQGDQPQGPSGQEGDDPSSQTDPDNKETPKPNEVGSKDKDDVKPDARRWGSLPPKVRSVLETNLGRDVPEDIEEDMKDFGKRMKELE